MKRKKVRKRIIYGGRMIPNAGIRARYGRDIAGMIRKLSAETAKRIMGIYPAKSPVQDSAAEEENSLLEMLGREIENAVSAQIQALVDRMLHTQDRYTDSSVNAAVRPLGEAFSLGSRPAMTAERTRNIMAACRMENVALIKGLADSWYSKVREAVARAVMNGYARRALQDELAEIEGISVRRAYRIAKDQTHKAYNALAYQKMRDCGVTHWQWLHGGGTKTERRTHVRDVRFGGLNHAIFRVGEKAYDPEAWPIAQRDGGGFEGAEIEPGELPFCSCIRRPVLELGDEEDSA